MQKEFLKRLKLRKDLRTVLDNAKSVLIPESRAQMIGLAMGDDSNDVFEVAYDVPGKGRVVEATVVRCKNGVSINYNDIYMRRRDPDCMVIADDRATDKSTYKERYGCDFGPVREKTFAWLAEQSLLVMPFMSGGPELGYPSLLVAPDNAGFFAGGLADLQGFVPADELEDGFEPRAIIYLAPPFRHTLYDGKQVVVHNRLEGMHEMFSYNLYPGPSAKKGVYGVLLTIGEEEEWVTVHGSTVSVATPYDALTTIMHEGASGGGKSEMIEDIHREPDGSVNLAENLVTGEKTIIELKDTCELHPVTDDMALCHPSLQNGSKKMVVKDAEQGWFLRINHITKYGTDPHYERLCCHPPEPLIFLNIDGAANSTCLIWEHSMDAPGKPCPNPRVIMPRRFVPGTVSDPVEIDIRSFGVRCPPCTEKKPTYGIIGFFHVLPPSLAWLWRLVAPRGHDNPSITDTEGMSSEGVGSYWPFATGRMVDQANLLYRQIADHSDTRYVLIPNQHIGAYRVGFMPEWLSREYLARRGPTRFKPDQLAESRCPLLGYALQGLKVDGYRLSRALLQVNRQAEVGEKGYDAGAAMLTKFFRKELRKFLVPDLDPQGRKIIECCMDGGALKDYMELIPTSQGL